MGLVLVAQVTKASESTMPEDPGVRFTRKAASGLFSVEESD